MCTLAHALAGHVPHVSGAARDGALAATTAAAGGTGGTGRRCTDAITACCDECLRTHVDQSFLSQIKFSLQVSMTGLCVGSLASLYASQLTNGGTCVTGQMIYFYTGLSAAEVRAATEKQTHLVCILLIILPAVLAISVDVWEQLFGPKCKCQLLHDEQL